MDAIGVKLLNSTVGTPDYIPLDELIRTGTKRLVASDAPLVKVTTDVTTQTGYSTDVTIYSPTVDICSVKPIVGGTARLVVGMTLSEWSASIYTTGTVFVFVNGVKKYEFSQSTTVDSTGYISKNITGDISFNANDEITFKLRASLSGHHVDTGTYGQAQVSSLALNASIVDNLVEIL